MRLALEELCHLQPASSVHSDNITVAGIVNDTIKGQQSRSMEMRYFWITIQVDIDNLYIQWHPGRNYLKDYFTKHVDSKYHQTLRSWYLKEAYHLILYHVQLSQSL